MADIGQMTEGYVAAFNARDLDKVADYLAEGFELTDPEVTVLTPKSAVLDYIMALFGAHKTLSFIAHSIVVDRDVSVIHFTLKLGAIVLDGVDIITWNNEKMTSMQAYLTQRK